jgi:biopolymer transport protein ExbD
VVDAGGHASLDGVAVDAGTLRTALSAYAARTELDARRAVVSADRRATHGDVVAVLDLVRGAEIGHVGVRVRTTP